MLKAKIIEKLKEITPEEREILDGQLEIDRNIYMQGSGNTVNSQKLLELGKLITVRKHTRFIDFPEHTHDYVELVYMLSGQTVHIVDGKKITLKQGELLFLGQNSRHAIEKAEENDIALNFIILPQFFGSTLSVIGDEDTPLKRFLIDCLCGDGDNNYYLHYRVSDITEIQNSVENLLLTVTGGAPNKRKLGQMTMALLFMQLMGRTENLEVKSRHRLFENFKLHRNELRNRNSCRGSGGTALRYKPSIPRDSKKNGQDLHKPCAGKKAFAGGFSA